MYLLIRKISLLPFIRLLLVSILLAGLLVAPLSLLGPTYGFTYNSQDSWRKGVVNFEQTKVFGSNYNPQVESKNFKEVYDLSVYKSAVSVSEKKLDKKITSYQKLATKPETYKIIQGASKENKTEIKLPPTTVRAEQLSDIPVAELTNNQTINKAGKQINDLESYNMADEKDKDQEILNISANLENVAEDDQEAMEVEPAKEEIQTLNLEEPPVTLSHSTDENKVSDDVNQEATELNVTNMQNNTTDPQTIDENLKSGEVVVKSGENEADTEITNDNESEVINDTEVVGNTGENTIEGKELEDAAIKSGDVNVLANIINAVNTNSTESELITIMENFNDLSADVLLNHPEMTQDQLIEALTGKICLVLQCENFDSFIFTTNNKAFLENNVNVAGNSGNNAILGGEEDAVIKTGDVNAVVNILNIINTNLINSVWTIAFINIFGDWVGDLVLPSELYFINHYSFRATDSPKDKIILDINGNNRAEVVNNINVDTQSGNNTITAVSSPDGSDGDIEDSQIITGDVRSGSNVQNIINTNIVNASWFLGIINTLGQWDGEIYSLPDPVAVKETPTGLTFLAASGADQDDIKALQEIIYDNLRGDGKKITVTSNNEARVVNNVNVEGNSGGNEISAGEMEDSSIITGSVKALANILNFVNTSLINTNFYIGLVNVLGDWAGNILFGYPDLAVSQNIIGQYPKEAGKDVNYVIDYRNNGNASADAVVLEWHYDPSLLELVSTDGVSYSETQKGVLKFLLNKLSPGAGGVIDLVLRTLRGIADDAVLHNYAQISARGPEKNIANNSHTLTTAVSPGLVAESFTSTDLIKIYKTNDAQNDAIYPGERVSFKIVVQNDANIDWQNAILYDVLIGPDGNVITKREFPLGTLLSREQVELEYILEVNASAPAGVYKNTAYLEAFGPDFLLFRSAQLAFSTFKVGDMVKNQSFLVGSLSRASASDNSDSEGYIVSSSQDDSASSGGSIGEQLDSEKNSAPPQTSVLGQSNTAGIKELINSNFIIISSLIALLYAFLGMRKRIING